jgi:hypothetical protein
VLAGCAAIGAAHVHDAVKAHDSLRRLVPALVAAQLVAALVIFWPSALLELKTAAADSGACDDLAARTLDPRAPALVFVTSGGAHRSWTYWKPMPSPTFDDRVLFANMDGPADDSALAAHFGSGRATYLARCVAEPNPRIERFDPKTGRTWPVGARPDAAK